jgi:hypothetical protein
MLVTGKPVTQEQAKEIIRRTDRFLVSGFGGNDHNYDQKLGELLKMPHTLHFGRQGYRNPHAFDPEKETYPENWERTEVWKEAWGCVETEYVSNDWISCAFIGGPHGWCHPDGMIGFVDNVGKWPDWESVFNDWKMLAEAFPFLDVAATLFSGESCEEYATPVISYLVKEGEVSTCPGSFDVHAGHPEARRAPAHAREEDFFSLAREHAIPWEWFEEWREDQLRGEGGS